MGFVYLILVLVLSTTASTAFYLRDVSAEHRAAAPYPVNDSTIFAGVGGCKPHWGYFEARCIKAGDYQSICIPAGDGGYRCICSPDHQLYSDGICKPKNLCDYTATDYNGDYYRICKDSGGVCKVDTTTKRGYTCDCTGTGKYTALMSQQYQCIADPCVSNQLYSTTCVTDGGTCTPRNGDGAKPLPYSCQCPGNLQFKDNDPDFPGPDCEDPCAKSRTGCEKCSRDVTKPHGVDCTCNDPNQVFIYALGCYDPCTGAPKNSTPWGLSPILSGVSVGFGIDACRRNDTGATCYTTEKSPLYYQCNCSPGYVNTFIYNGTGTTYYSMESSDMLITCVDVDECAVPDPCGADKSATCTNLPGSFDCQCSPNYYNYQKKCVFNECTLPYACGTADLGAVCYSVAGVKSCNCSTGFTLVGGNCVKDWCANVTTCGKLDKAAVCTNTNDSYTCTCSTGFQLNGNECIKSASTVDTACAKADPQDGNPCNNAGDKNSSCTGTCSTTYTCKCSQGYWSNKGVCQDANECESKINPCPTLGCGRNNNTLCRNTQGSHSCSCGDGSKCPCGTPADCSKKSDRLMKCKCGEDVYYYY